MRPTSVRRPVLRLWWIALCLLVVPVSGHTAALIEMRIHGAQVRLVADRAGARALLSAGDMRALFDLAGGSVYVSAGGISRRVHARFRPGYADTPYRVELFGAGPVLAGFVTRYHVLFIGEQICAELMAASWMTPFVDPAVRALGILEALQPSAADPCGTVPLTTYAAVGWPLIAGKIDHPTLETTKIAFDYQPQGGELVLPTSFEEGDLQLLREVAKAAGL